jgi:hypothetical protein
MTATYESIATTTLGSAAASVTFSTIPGTYTDLVIVFNGVSTAASFIKRIKFNGDTGANYSATALYGTGSSAASARYSESWLDVVNAGTNDAMTIIHIMNYSNTTTNKTYLSRHSSAAASTEAVVGLWRSTAAITSVLIEGNSGNQFASGCVFTLYGIKAE